MIQDAEKAFKFLWDKYIEQVLEMIADFVEGNYTLAIIRLFLVGAPVVFLLWWVLWDRLSEMFVLRRQRKEGIKPGQLTEQELRNLVNGVIVTPYNPQNNERPSIADPSNPATKEDQHRNVNSS